MILQRCRVRLDYVIGVCVCACVRACVRVCVCLFTCGAGRDTSWVRVCRGQGFGLLSHLVKLIKDRRHPVMAPHSCPNTDTHSLTLTVILHSLQSLQLTKAHISKPFIPESLRKIFHPHDFSCSETLYYLAVSVSQIIIVQYCSKV